LEKIVHADNMINFLDNPENEKSNHKTRFSFMHSVLQAMIEAVPLQKFFFEDDKMQIVIRSGLDHRDTIVHILTKIFKDAMTDHDEVLE
jgi:hypothetical protein